jgi:hypothetical protein
MYMDSLVLCPHKMLLCKKYAWYCIQNMQNVEARSEMAEAVLACPHYPCCALRRGLVSFGKRIRCPTYFVLMSFMYLL